MKMNQDGEGREGDGLGPSSDDGWYFDLPSGAWERQEQKNRELRESVRQNIDDGPEHVLPPDPFRGRQRGRFGRHREDEPGLREFAGGKWTLTPPGDIAEDGGETPALFGSDESAFEHVPAASARQPAEAQAGVGHSRATVRRAEPPGWEQEAAASPEPEPESTLDAMREWLDRANAAPVDEAMPAPSPATVPLVLRRVPWPGEVAEPTTLPAARERSASRWDEMFGAGAGDGGIDGMRAWARGTPAFREGEATQPDMPGEEAHFEPFDWEERGETAPAPVFVADTDGETAAGAVSAADPAGEALEEPEDERYAPGREWEPATTEVRLVNSWATAESEGDLPLPLVAAEKRPGLLGRLFGRKKKADPEAAEDASPFGSSWTLADEDEFPSPGSAEGGFATPAEPPWEPRRTVAGGVPATGAEAALAEPQAAPAALPVLDIRGDADPAGADAWNPDAFEVPAGAGGRWWDRPSTSEDDGLAPAARADPPGRDGEVATAPAAWPREAWPTDFQDADAVQDADAHIEDSPASGSGEFRPNDFEAATLRDATAGGFLPGAVERDVAAETQPPTPGSSGGEPGLLAAYREGAAGGPGADDEDPWATFIAARRASGEPFPKGEVSADNDPAGRDSEYSGNYDGQGAPWSPPASAEETSPWATFDSREGGGGNVETADDPWAAVAAASGYGGEPNDIAVYRGHGERQQFAEMEPAEIGGGNWGDELRPAEAPAWAGPQGEDDVVLRAFYAHANSEVGDEQPMELPWGREETQEALGPLLGVEAADLVEEVSGSVDSGSPYPERGAGWPGGQVFRQSPREDLGWGEGSSADRWDAPAPGPPQEPPWGPPRNYGDEYPGEPVAARGPGRSKTIVREVVETVLLAVLVFLSVRASFQNFKVDGSSMFPTLENGQFLIVNKLVYAEVDTARLAKFVPFISPGENPQKHVFNAPERGDIIVLKDPRMPSQDLIKRIIGLPGDTIEIQNGRVYINDFYLQEPYIQQQWNGNMAKIRIPANEYFVMGDNRENSLDSRSSQVGLIREELIIGKAMFSYWPTSQFGLAPNGSPKLGAARPKVTTQRLDQP